MVAHCLPSFRESCQSVVVRIEHGFSPTSAQVALLVFLPVIGPSEGALYLPVIDFNHRHFARPSSKQSFGTGRFITLFVFCFQRWHLAVCVQLQRRHAVMGDRYIHFIRGSLFTGQGRNE